MSKSSSKGGGKPPSPNDQRSNAHNPTSAAHKAAQDNLANQLNPEHPAYHSSRTGQPIPRSPAPSPNDQRSNVHNPTSAANKAARDNRANQLNSEHPVYHSSRGHSDKERND